MNGLIRNTFLIVSLFVFLGSFDVSAESSIAKNEKAILANIISSIDHEGAGVSSSQEEDASFEEEKSENGIPMRFIYGKRQLPFETLNYGKRQLPFETLNYGKRNLPFEMLNYGKRDTNPMPFDALLYGKRQLPFETLNYGRRKRTTEHQKKPYAFIIGKRGNEQ